MEVMLDRKAVFRYGYHWVGEEEEAAEQIEFARRLLYLPVGSKVLMPFCGPGWYAHELAMWGFQVVGMEVVAQFLVEARERANRLGLMASFLMADPLHLPFYPHTFDGAMIIGNRFGLTGEEVTDRALLHKMAELLKPKGRLVMLLPHRDGMLHTLKERDWEMLPDNSRILILRQWDAMKGQMWEEWRDVDSRPEPRLFVVIYRVYTATELECLLRECGFRLINVFGNFLGAALTHESRWMLVQAIRD